MLGYYGVLRYTTKFNSQLILRNERTIMKYLEVKSLHSGTAKNNVFQYTGCPPHYLSFEEIRINN